MEAELQQKIQSLEKGLTRANEKVEDYKKEFDRLNTIIQNQKLAAFQQSAGLGTDQSEEVETLKKQLLFRDETIKQKDTEMREMAERFQAQIAERDLALIRRQELADEWKDKHEALDTLYQELMSSRARSQSRSQMMPASQQSVASEQDVDDVNLAQKLLASEAAKTAAQREAQSHREQHEVLIHTRGNLQQEIAQLKSELSDMQKQFMSADEGRKQAEAAMHDAQSRAKSAAQAVQEISKALKEHTEGGGSLRQQYDELKAQFAAVEAKHQQQLEELKQQNVTATVSLHEKVSSLERTSSQSTEKLQPLNARITELSDQLVASKKEKDELAIQMGERKRQIDELTQKLAAAEKQLKEATSAFTAQTIKQQKEQQQQQQQAASSQETAESTSFMSPPAKRIARTSVTGTPTVHNEETSVQESSAMMGEYLGKFADLAIKLESQSKESMQLRSDLADREKRLAVAENQITSLVATNNTLNSVIQTLESKINSVTEHMITQATRAQELQTAFTQHISSTPSTSRPTTTTTEETLSSTPVQASSQPPAKKGKKGEQTAHPMHVVGAHSSADLDQLKEFVSNLILDSRTSIVNAVKAVDLSPLQAINKSMDKVQSGISALSEKVKDQTANISTLQTVVQDRDRDLKPSVQEVLARISELHRQQEAAINAAATNGHSTNGPVTPAKREREEPVTRSQTVISSPAVAEKSSAPIVISGNDDSTTASSTKSGKVAASAPVVPASSPTRKRKQDPSPSTAKPVRSVTEVVVAEVTEGEAEASEQADPSPAAPAGKGKRGRKPTAKLPEIPPPAPIPKVIVVSGVDPSERSSIIATAQQLGATVKTDDSFDDTITHLVCAVNKRTFKLLAASVTGAYIITADWIKDSGKAGSFLPEENYGWRFPAKPFAGKKFALSNKFKAESAATEIDTAKKVIVLGGGEDVSFGTKCDYVVLAPEETFKSKPGVKGLSWAEFLSLLPTSNTQQLSKQFDDIKAKK